MIICGVKLTHDAAVALIDDGRLVFSIELEKLNNNRRYSEMPDLALLPEILSSRGYRMEDVDRFVLDGWHGSGQAWRGDPLIARRSGDRALSLEVAAYNELSLKENILARKHLAGRLPIGGRAYDYESYMHVAGHVLGTYCASPFARANEPSYVLVWDGGQYPRLYYVDPVRRSVQNKGHLFFFLGTIYGIMGHYFGPYAKTDAELEEDRRKQDLEGYFGGYSVAGKIMSYIALGAVQPDLLSELPQIHRRELEVTNTFEHRFMRALKAHVKDKGYSDADVLLTQHTFLQGLLVSGLEQKVQKDRLSPQNFCFSGGSALNIKWNSAIRQSGLFRATWVPPFPNDSGSALGAACCEMVSQLGKTALEWSVYSGPELIVNDPAPGWRRGPCTLGDLARLLAAEGEPVVFLNGAAELGPRALGNRSIVAPATDPAMKDTLNRVKKRERFRPVAPICMEEHAPRIFDPGCHDPFMLFDHLVRDDWKSVVPAICHLDGTARLQTVSERDNPAMYELLTAYHEITGIPLLCNTSANINGSGFFPDVHSATRWGGVNYVWCGGALYEKEERVALL
jgi:carbamoyltransferase